MQGGLARGPSLGKAEPLQEIGGLLIAPPCHGQDRGVGTEQGRDRQRQHGGQWVGDTGLATAIGLKAQARLVGVSLRHGPVDVAGLVVGTVDSMARFFVVPVCFHSHARKGALFVSSLCLLTHELSWPWGHHREWKWRSGPVA
jgi:hypothetical protein